MRIQIWQIFTLKKTGENILLNDSIETDNPGSGRVMDGTNSYNCIRFKDGLQIEYGAFLSITSGDTIRLHNEFIDWPYIQITRFMSNNTFYIKRTANMEFSVSYLDTDLTSNIGFEYMAIGMWK